MFIPLPFEFVQKSGEVNNEPSLTQPDLSLSVGEILRRFRRGLSTPDDLRDPFYYDEEDFPGVDFSLFDDIDDITDIGILKDRLTTLKTELYEQVSESRESNRRSPVVPDGSSKSDETERGTQATLE